MPNNSTRVERLIRRNLDGTYAVMLSRHVRTVNGRPQSRAVYHGGIPTLDEARTRRAALEALDPPRRPGRKPAWGR